MTQTNASSTMIVQARFLNLFQYCSRALQILGSVMCLMVVGIVGFSLYSVLWVYAPLLVSGSILKAIAGGFVSFWFSIMVGTVSAFAM